MDKINELKESLKIQDISLLGTNIGEQGYITSKLNLPVFFLSSSVENAYKISEQLTALNVKNVLIDSFDD